MIEHESVASKFDAKRIYERFVRSIHRSNRQATWGGQLFQREKDLEIFLEHFWNNHFIGEQFKEAPWQLTAEGKMRIKNSVVL